MITRRGRPWRDLVADVGGTALFIAALRAAESARPDLLFGRDPLAEALVEGIDAETSRLWLDEDGAPIALSRGLHDYVAMRTRYFDEFLTRSSPPAAAMSCCSGPGWTAAPSAWTCPAPPSSRSTPPGILVVEPAEPQEALGSFPEAGHGVGVEPVQGRLQHREHVEHVISKELSATETSASKE